MKVNRENTVFYSKYFSQLCNTNENKTNPQHLKLYYNSFSFHRGFIKAAF